MSDDVLNKPISELDYIMHDDELDYEYADCLCMAEDFLEHHGIKGMRWGIRRSLEELGYKVHKKRVQRKQQKLAMTKKRTKLKMKELEIAEQQKALKKKSTPAGQEEIPKKDKKSIYEDTSIDNILKKENRAQLLKKKMTSLSDQDLRNITNRLNQESILRKQASDESDRLSRIESVRGKAKKFRDIVGEVESTKKSVETATGLLKIKKKTDGGSKGDSGSKKSSLSTIDFKNVNLNSKGGKAVLKQIKTNRTREYKIAQNNQKIIKSSINRGLSMAEKYVATDITSRVFDTAYKYSLDDKRVARMIKRFS